MQVIVSINHMPSILRYVSKTHRKEAESPFNGGKVIRKDNGTGPNTPKKVP